MFLPDMTPDLRSNPNSRSNGHMRSNGGLSAQHHEIPNVERIRYPALGRDRATSTGCERYARPAPGDRMRVTAPSSTISRRLSDHGSRLCPFEQRDVPTSAQKTDLIWSGAINLSSR